ncbi:MAG: hybrid sensor histidine kinase/response regulator [Spirochaetales bacterium]
MAENEHPRILVVDDVAANVAMVGAVLRAEGFLVSGAQGAVEAMEVLQSQSVDLILLDVMMPVTNGFDFSRRLHAMPETADLPVIFLSALSNEHEIVQGFEAGGVDYVSKPFHKQELLSRVRTHLTLRKARQDLKEQNLVLARTSRELKESNLARDKFLSILAHDLRNPFAGIMSLQGEIRDNLETFSAGELRSAVDAIQTSTQAIYNLLTTLLEWGKAQTGVAVFQFSSFSVSSAVEQALAPLQSMLALKELTLRVEVGATQVWAELASVVSIIRNLLSNAVKFTKRSGLITVVARTEGDQTVIEVKDTGLGMTPEMQDQLFRLDVKVSTLGTEKESGTGLGLLLCREFADRNSGSLDVESVSGVGTVFRLRLPSNKDGGT